MGYTHGQMSIPGLVAAIAAELVTFTDNWEMVDENMPGGYCLKYKPDNVYVGLSVTLNHLNGKNGSTSYKSAGILVTFSTGYSVETHTPSGSIQRGIAPLFQGDDSNVGANASVYLGAGTNYVVSYHVDKDGVVAAIQNPISGVTSLYYPTGVVFGLEAMTDDVREYADGYTHLVFYSQRNYERTNYTALNCESDVEGHAYYNVRPFFKATNHPTINFVSKAAVRSIGNSKIYFDFPKIHNTPIDFRDPILISKKFVIVDSVSGLAVGDVLSWLDVDEVNVRKFRVEEASSLNTGVKVYVAIAYSNPIQY